MEPSLYHTLFTRADTLPRELLDAPGYLRDYLLAQVEEQHGYPSSQVEEYVAMLVEEFCPVEIAA
jgi:hypothetical protein